MATDTTVAAKVSSHEFTDLPYKLEKIPNVLTSTLGVENASDNDTVSMYLMSFTHKNEEYGTTICVPEVSREVNPEVEAEIIAQLTENYYKATTTKGE